MRGLAAGMLVAFACVALRMCDAISEAELANAVAGAGLGGSGGASALGAIVVYLALAVGIVFLVVRAARQPATAVLVVAIGSVIAVVLIWSSSAHIARTRSDAVDTWSLCEKPGTSPQGYGVYVWSSSHAPDFDGPHLTGGDPCVHEDEHRDVHAREHPGGDVLDGLHQIMYRFPSDRMRVVIGPLVLLLGLLFANGLTIWQARRKPEPPPA